MAKSKEKLIKPVADVKNIVKKAAILKHPKKAVIASKANLSGKEIRKESCKEKHLAGCDFSGTTFIDCDFSAVEKITRCNLSNSKFLVSSKGEDGEVLTAYAPFEKIVFEKLGEDENMSERTVSAEIINCDVTGTELESQRIPFV